MMKRAVSISPPGSSKRNSAVEPQPIGREGSHRAYWHRWRHGTRRPALWELDGKVDAFGVGGTDLGLTVDGKYYRLHSVAPLVRFVKQTPVVDGSGLKNTLERG